MSPGDDTWRRAPDVAHVDDGDRVVVLDLTDPRTSRPQLLTGPAAQIWRGLEGQRSTEAVIAAVAETSGLSALEIGPDVRAFLATLEARGLVRR